MSAKKWCAVFVLSVLLIAVLFGGFNAAVDPFGVFGDPFFNWYSYNMTNNPRAAKIAYLDRHHGEYDSYIVGSSSCSSYPVEVLNEKLDAQFFNMIMYGSDMKDVEQTCRYLIENYTVKNLVVDLFITNGYKYDVGGEGETTRLHAAVDHSSRAAFYAQYLFLDPRYAMAKLSAAGRDTVLSQPFDVFDVQTGAYDKRARDAEPIGRLDRYLEVYSGFKNYRAEAAPLDKIEECTQSLAAIQKLCAEHGVRLITTFSPVYRDQFSFYARADVEKFFRAIADTVPFWDFSISSVSREPRYFYDETHFRNDVGRMAAERMFGGDGYVPADFGVYVTPDNVDSRLQQIYQTLAAPPETDYTAKVPVLMYHQISAEPDGASVTAAEFEGQMRTLSEAGFHAVGMEELIAYVDRGVPLPEKPVCITFDDGYEGNYQYAYPVLKKYQMKATIFAIGSSVGAKEHYKDTNYPITPHFSWEQAREMEASGLVRIESHTWDMHQWEPFEEGEARKAVQPLTGESDEQYAAALLDDWKTMDEAMRRELGHGIQALAYPNGVFDTLAEALWNGEGLRVSFSTEQDQAVLIKGLRQSLYNLPRCAVWPETSGEALKNLLER